MKVLLNGRLADARQARISVFDHGFLYGDGVYETVRAYRGRIFHWREHDRRLRESARRLALACPWSSAVLQSHVGLLLRANRQLDASVRITVTRGPGPLGLDPAVCPRPTLAMMLHPERPLERIWREGVSLGIVRVRRTPPESLDPRIKSNNALNTILARMEASCLKVFEAVLLNGRGDLTEGTTSNVFFLRRGTLHTPALSCGLLAGVTRETLLRLARRLGWPVREGRYAPRDLAQADEIFLSSTTLEVAPVVRLVTRGLPPGAGVRREGVGDGRPGPLTRTLHRAYRELVARELRLRGVL